MRKKKKNRTNLGFDAPDDVLYLKMCGHIGKPVGSDFYEKTVKKYPEHFPSEYKRIMAWEAIPKEVHDAYWKEYWELDQELRKNAPEGGGIFEQMSNSEKAQEFNSWWKNEYWPKHEVMEKKLHKKHYGKYGY